MLIETCHYSNFAFIDIVHSVVNFNCDFTLLPGVPFHYCQLNVSFVGESFIVFLETWVNCKGLSI